MANSIRNIGAEFGYVGDEALEAGARAAQLQALYGSGVVEPMARGGLALGFVGDMGGTEAQQSLISLMQQNAIVTGDLTQAQYANLSAMEQRAVVTASVANTLNTLNSVEDRSAARMPEIIEAMNHFGGVARLAGEDIGFMAAMTATLIERGIRAETAGTALRFTYARVGGNINGAGDALAAYGVATHDANGELRPMQKILNELAPAFQNMSDQEKQALAQTMAGNRHYARLLLLMQDLERANMLHGEAIAQTGKVMEETGEAAGYLAQLFADTAFQIEQTEARITNLQAAIGEKLLPAQLNALQAQEDMLIAINAIIDAFGDSPMGEFLGDLYEMRAILMNIYAPFAIMLLNVYAVQIALGGLHMVLKAVSGQQIAFIKGQQSNLDVVNAKEALRTHQITVSNTKMLAQAILGKIQTRQMVLRNQLLADKVVKQDVGIMQMRLEHLIRKQIALEALKDAKNQKTMIALTQVRKDIKMLELQIQNAITQSSKAQSDIIKEINLLEQEHMVKVDLIFRLTEDLIILQERLTGEIEAMNAELTKSGMLAEGVGHQLSTAQMGGMAFGMAAMFMSAALMVLGTKINALLPKFLEFDNQAEVMVGAMVLLAASFAPVIINMVVTITVLTHKAILLGINTAYQIKLTTQNVWAAIVEAYQAKAIWSNITAFFAKIPAMVKNIIAAAGLAIANMSLAFSEGVAAAGGWSLAAALQAVMWTIIGILGLTGVGVALIALAAAAVYAVKELGILEVGAEDMMGTTADLADMEIPTFDMSGFDSYTDSLMSATDAQDKFNNSREEMFFGFKAGNVQGALVKQIKQQGVETFIANTEIIQTNNFNGLTTRQMANTILDAIESEAGVRGINLSGASV